MNVTDGQAVDLDWAKLTDGMVMIVGVVSFALLVPDFHLGICVVDFIIVTSVFVVGGVCRGS